jgi:hypothetical protein
MSISEDSNKQTSSSQYSQQINNQVSQFSQQVSSTQVSQINQQSSNSHSTQHIQQINSNSFMSQSSNSSNIMQFQQSATTTLPKQQQQSSSQEIQQQTLRHSEQLHSAQEKQGHGVQSRDESVQQGRRTTRSRCNSGTNDTVVQGHRFNITNSLKRYPHFYIKGGSLSRFCVKFLMQFVRSEVTTHSECVRLLLKLLNFFEFLSELVYSVSRAGLLL